MKVLIFPVILYLLAKSISLVFGLLRIHFSVGAWRVVKIMVFVIALLVSAELIMTGKFDNLW